MATNTLTTTGEPVDGEYMRHVSFQEMFNDKYDTVNINVYPGTSDQRRCIVNWGLNIVMSADIELSGAQLTCYMTDIDGSKIYWEYGTSYYPSKYASVSIYPDIPYKLELDEYNYRCEDFITQRIWTNTSLLNDKGAVTIEITIPTSDISTWTNSGGILAIAMYGEDVPIYVDYDYVDSSNVNTLYTSETKTHYFGDTYIWVDEDLVPSDRKISGYQSYDPNYNLTDTILVPSLADISFPYDHILRVKTKQKKDYGLIYYKEDDNDKYNQFPSMQEFDSGGTKYIQANIGENRVDHIGKNFTHWYNPAGVLNKDKTKVPGNDIYLDRIIGSDNIKYLTEVCSDAPSLTLGTNATNAIQTVNLDQSLRDLYYWGFNNTSEGYYTIRSTNTSSYDQQTSIYIGTDLLLTFESQQYNIYCPTAQMYFSQKVTDGSCNVSIQIHKSPTLILNANGGTFKINNNSSLSIDIKETDQYAFSIPYIIPYKTQYNFLYWKDEDNNVYYPGDTYIITDTNQAYRNHTLTAVWTSPETLTLNSLVSGTVYGGGRYWFKYTPTTKQSFTFYTLNYGKGSSWEIRSYNGLTTQYNNPYDNFDFINKENATSGTTYYYYIDYLDNYGILSKQFYFGNINTINYYKLHTDTTPWLQAKKYYNLDLQITDQVPERLGWEFLGWSTTKSNTGSIYTQDTLSSETITAFYAQWKCLSSVTIHTKNADNTITPKQVLAYVYKDGLWQTAIPYIYTSGEWKPCAWRANENKENTITVVKNTYYTRENSTSPYSIESSEQAFENDFGVYEINPLTSPNNTLYYIEFLLEINEPTTFKIAYSANIYEIKWDIAGFSKLLNPSTTFTMTYASLKDENKTNEHLQKNTYNSNDTSQQTLDYGTVDIGTYKLIAYLAYDGSQSGYETINKHDDFAFELILGA